MSKILTRQQLAALSERVDLLESQLAAKEAAAKVDTPAKIDAVEKRRSVRMRKGSRSSRS